MLLYRYVIQIQSGLHRCPGEFLSDVCDGTIFGTNAILRDDEQALQIIGYYDEFTIVNPLSSRAKKHKIGTLSLW